MILQQTSNVGVAYARAAYDVGDQHSSMLQAESKADNGNTKEFEVELAEEELAAEMQAGATDHRSHSHTSTNQNIGSGLFIARLKRYEKMALNSVQNLSELPWGCRGRLFWAGS